MYDCNKCKYLNITEYQQNICGKKIPHMCKKYNKRVLHRDNYNDHHPQLVPYEKCNQFIAMLVNLVK